MKKMSLYFATVLIIIIISFVFVAFAKDNNSHNIEFLKSFGWQVLTFPIEKENFTLPAIPNDVYISYNRIQTEAGLDLTPYYGKSGVRYTYAVLNYPYPIQDVRANVLTIDSIPVAGDIMTIKSDGFMHSLKFPTD